MAGCGPEGGTRFDAAFRTALTELIRWRRDVRHFRPDPVASELVARLVALASLAPSVGYSQPWRFVSVESSARRAAVRASYLGANAEALGGYGGERRALYARLKLEGLDVAPVQLAVFAAHDAETGHGLGRRTMPETLAYSVVCAVHTFWLAARAEGLGVGWVSILEPASVTRALDVPEAWQLVAYLCVGWPAEEHGTPELERAGWETRLGDAASIIVR